MKATQTLIATTKELPKEAVLTSHQYMLKAGFDKKTCFRNLYMDAYRIKSSTENPEYSP